MVLFIGLLIEARSNLSLQITTITISSRRAFRCPSIINNNRAGVAQLVEQAICNRQVGSSNLSAGTSKEKMNKVCKKIDYIPQVPQNLIDDLAKIESYENVFPEPEYADHYSSHVAQKNLEEWGQQQFDYPVKTRYQLVRQNLPIHEDVGIIGTKYNYLITLGGSNVKTRWWDNVNEPNNMIYEKTWTNEDINQWYQINIAVPHQVVNMEEPRISITIRKA